MNNILEVDDPRGAHIVLTEENWEKHIKRRHKEMETKLDLIAETLKNPFPYIYRDAIHENRLSYYSKPDHMYIKVSVEMLSEKYGIVRTAMRCSTCKKGEEIEWAYSNRYLISEK